MKSSVLSKQAKYIKLLHHCRPFLLADKYFRLNAVFIVTLYISSSQHLFVKFPAGKTSAINFRETVNKLERAETMRDFQHLMFEWKERGKDSLEDNH